MTCQFCGGEIPNGSAFCTKCGKPVETMVSVEEKKESLSASLPVTDSAPKSSSGKEKSKSLIAPLVTLIAAVSGWIIQPVLEGTLYIIIGSSTDSAIIV